MFFTADGPVVPVSGGVCPGCAVGGGARGGVWRVSLLKFAPPVPKALRLSVRHRPEPGAPVTRPLHHARHGRWSVMEPKRMSVQRGMDGVQAAGDVRRTCSTVLIVLSGLVIGSSPLLMVKPYSQLIE